MALIHCPECNKKISETAASCPSCGRAIKAEEAANIKKAEEKASQTRTVGCVAAFLLAALLVAMCSPKSSGPESKSSSDLFGPSTLHVTYKVEGSSGCASLTMSNEQGGTEQMDVVTPWSRVMTVGRGQFLYISAQNLSEFGSISCTITVDGAILKESDSEGAYKIASCSGRAE